MNTPPPLAGLLGPDGPTLVAAMKAAGDFLETHDTASLLACLGQRIDAVPPCTPIDKRALPASYGGNAPVPSDDLLAGRGLFYLTEQRRLFLDCTSGHYQMLWGYDHPGLGATIAEAVRAGVVWDNHSNLPQGPLKQLARRLIHAANAPGTAEPRDKVLLGVCTGSVACAAALKIQLKMFERRAGAQAVPVVVVLDGNYHGTDLVPQFMRGLWPHLARPVEVVVVQPNDADQLDGVFRRHGERTAGFWAEPVMMNREAIAVTRGYLLHAQAACRRVGALFCLDEIQTGFWRPEIFEFRALGLDPDLVVVGKGMAAGFHPLSAVLMRRQFDVLEQYDAISTNGSAALPALVALASMAMIEQEAPRLAAIGQRLERGFGALALEFPEALESAQGRGHLLGLKFRAVDDAKRFQSELLAAGLWTRVHAYHEGHRTVLTKLGLLADDAVVEFLLTTCRRQLETMTAARHPSRNRDLASAGATLHEPAH